MINIGDVTCIDLMMKTVIKLLGRKDESSALALKNRVSDMPPDAEDDKVLGVVKPED
jgi:hypothetical protein